MKTINCNQLLNYYSLEEFAILDVLTIDGETEVFLTDGLGEYVYSCKESEMTEDKQEELRVMLDSFAAIVVYDFNQLKETLSNSEMITLYQPLICDVATDLAALIGTYDYGKENWLVRSLDEALTFYRYQNALNKPEDRAKAIVWLAGIVTNCIAPEIMIRREQKLKDYREIKRYLSQPVPEGK